MDSRTQLLRELLALEEGLRTGEIGQEEYAQEAARLEALLAGGRQEAPSKDAEREADISSKQAPPPSQVIAPAADAFRTAAPAPIPSNAAHEAVAPSTQPERAPPLPGSNAAHGDAVSSPDARRAPPLLAPTQTKTALTTETSESSPHSEAVDSIQGSAPHEGARSAAESTGGPGGPHPLAAGGRGPALAAGGRGPALAGGVGHGGDVFLTGLGRVSLSDGWLREGELLCGRYRVEGLLGVGGMGVVYKVEDALERRSLAMKLMHPEQGGDAQERLRQELAVQERLSHGGIVETHALEVEAETQRLFFTMEYIEGPSLAMLLTEAQAEGKVPPFAMAWTLDVMTQLVGVLDYAHGMGVIHRDLKPSNILLEKGQRVKLLDFGIAKQVSEQTLHHTGLVGTPVYMAPEQWQAGTPVRPTADVYALGVLLYQLLTGAPSLFGRMPGPHEYLHEQGHSPPFPASVDDVVLKAIDALPHRRYESCAALLEALEQALQGPSTGADPGPSRTQRSPTQLVHEGRVSGQGRAEAKAQEEPKEAPALAKLPGWGDGRVVDLSGATLSRGHWRALRAQKQMESLILCGAQSDAGPTGLLEGLASLGARRGLRKLDVSFCALGDAVAQELARFADLEDLNAWGIGLSDPGVEALAQSTSLRRLSLGGNTLGADAVQVLGQMFQVEALSLAYTSIPPEAMAGLMPLESLQALDVRGCWDAAAMKVLRFFPRMQRLSLDEAALQEAPSSLAYLSCMPALRSLSLADCGVTDAALAPLAACPRLEELDLSSCPVRGTFLDFLAGSPPLRTLNLCASDVSDRIAPSIGRLERLHTLLLRNTHVTDALLPALQPLRSLHMLDLRGCSVSTDAASQLQTELPRCTIRLS